MSAVAAGSAALTRLSFLADDTDVGDETHKAGPIAIIVIIALCVACFILFRSMTKHLRRVREEFPGAEADGSTVAEARVEHDTEGGEPVDATAPSGPATTSSGAAAGRPTPKSRATDDSTAG